ncbi:hypothetical protein EZV62_022798 [Acer yangbiense]|uniref:CCHC-type domain-containing protein n=1 Tax=Acer yangbiense TaxID=1000413 RepID=A0A5C7GZR2_9ROSI|nr:hypothetical protein EZV62_022798 [Acer yangbiense]
MPRNITIPYELGTIQPDSCWAVLWEDQFRVLAGGPWSFDDSLLVLKKLEGDGKISGDMVDIDVGSSGECFGKYLRIRVAIDVLKPLKRFLRLELTEKGKESMVLLRYERLPEYCFRCGILGHSFRECHTVGEDVGQSSEFDFRPWLCGGGKEQAGRLDSRTEGNWRKSRVDVGNQIQVDQGTHTTPIREISDGTVGLKEVPCATRNENSGDFFHTPEGSSVPSVVECGLDLGTKLRKLVREESLKDNRVLDVGGCNDLGKRVLQEPVVADEVSPQ